MAEPDHNAHPRNTTLQPATVADVAFLCQHMREDERAQVLALTHFDAYDPDAVARMLVAKQGPAFSVVREDGMPVVTGGFEPVALGVWQTWMVTCDLAWSEFGLAVTRHVRKTMDSLLQSEGCHRIQTNALTAREEAVLWYERALHMQREGVLRAFGKHGEDIVLFSRVREGGD